MRNEIFVELGNTNAKWKFKGKYFFLPTKIFEFDKLPVTAKIWASNVSQKFFDSKELNVTFIESQKRYKSLISSYKEPKSLGSDRWFALIASYEKYQRRNLILVDIGTAITIDAINKSGMHLGGVIFPGLEKIRESFNFPFITSHEKIDGVGQSTEEGWTIGTLSVVVNSIIQKVKELEIKLPNSSIIVTGGGYKVVQDFLDFGHIYDKNLVLDGLEFYAHYMR